MRIAIARRRPALPIRGGRPLARAVLLRRRMRAATGSPLRLLPEGRPARSSGRRRAGWLLPTAVAVALLLLLLAIGSNLSPERRALRALPPEERAALVSRSVDDLRRFCGEGRADALRDHCRELASFAARFAECRGECEALVRRQLTPTPTR